MSKEVEKKVCNQCESSYKLLFDLNDTSGYPKFCPFCGSENYCDDDELKYENEEE